MKPHDQAPNGIFLDGLLLFGGLETGAIAARGFWVVPPDVRGASFARLNAFQDQIRGLLALVTEGRRLQVQWFCDCDYRSELQRMGVQDLRLGMGVGAGQIGQDA